MPSELRPSFVVAVLVLVVLAALTLQCLVALVQHPVAHGDWRVGLSAVAVTGVWLLLNDPLEGAVVLVVTHDHGLTVGDLLGIPPLLLGGALLALAVPASA